MDPQPTAGAVTDASPTRPGESTPPGGPKNAPEPPRPPSGRAGDGSPVPPRSPAGDAGPAGDGSPVPPPHAHAWPGTRPAGDGSPFPPTHAHAWIGPAGPPGAPVPPPRPRSLAWRLSAPLAALTGVAAAFAYVGTVDPNEPGHYPVCPLLRFTGVYCPGCGGLRSAHAFVHGDLPAALGANALAVVGYGLFGVLMALWLIRAVRGVPMRLAITPAWGWGIGAALALFTLVRNLPFGSALAP
ncbi:DUF2752 domain-containing protein [Streptomyces sp. NPDC093795]|uniref:DUF2752 domain-containing protein n=1 Tax=Streptomyces sp. NPDC093795 TaxID=3366051 RepID=UPI0037F53DEA